MPPDAAIKYTYTGLGRLGYPSYADVATGEMLIAEPGGSYAIRAVNEGDPVPPGDGRWETPAPAKTAKTAAKTAGGGE